MKSHQYCVSRLDALSLRARAEFDAEPLLRDIAERNFEVAAQCVIDIAMRAGSIEQAPRTSDAGDAIRRMAELGILTPAAAAVRTWLRTRDQGTS